MVKSKAKKVEVIEEEPEPLITDKGITPNEMAKHIMNLAIFKTFQDTEQILIYNPKTGIYQFNGDANIKSYAEKTLQKHNLGGQATEHYMNEVMGHIERNTYVSRGKFNSTQQFINLTNGRLDLDAMELCQHTPDFLSTFRIPVEFDPLADCPMIRRFFNQIVAKENVPLLEEIFGWCLDVRSPIQRALLFIGEGANGKGTFLRLLLAFLGKGNCAAIPLQMFSTNRFASSQLYGKLANIYADLPNTKLKDSSFLKTLTGGDMIPAEEKFQKSFMFVNHAKLLFSANDPPVIEDDSKAFWRRMIIIVFPNTFMGEQDDQGLDDKLKTPDELSGLLNVAIKGLKRLRENHGFTYTPSWKDTLEKYSNLSDPVGMFVDDDCVLDAIVEIDKPTLFKAYIDFCRRKRMPAGTKQAFGRTLKKKFNRNIGERQNNWTGITLKNAK